MAKRKSLYEILSIWSPRKRVSYAVNGMIMGLGAPLGWLLISLLFFRPVHQSPGLFLLHEFFGSPERIFLFFYMTLGTSFVMSVTGYLVGRGFDWNDEREAQLKKIQAEIEERKRVYKERLLRLQNDMSNLYRISTDIQRSHGAEQIFQLLVDGAYRILGFDRVNLFLLDQEKKTLECRQARGHDTTEWKKIRIPLSGQGGALEKTIRRNEVQWIQDIRMMPQEYRLGDPYCKISELRSRSFASIPLRERGEPIGSVAVDNKHTGRPIRDEELSTLKILADQSSIALTNLSLYQGIQELHRELDRNFDELFIRKKDFSDRMGELSKQSGRISKNVQRVAESAEGLLKTVNDTTSSMHEMSGSLQEVASGVNILSQEAQRTLSSAEKMSAAIQEVESHVQDSNSLAGRVQKEAEEGATLVTDSIREISEIRDLVLDSVEVVRQLGKRMEEIGEVLEVINTINEKTNVLALNAAIISAQAGEHGKGFGVVSNEIRALSERTASSSREIEKMIESVQEQVKEAVAKIRSIPERVDSGLDVSKRAGNALNRILNSVQSSLEMTQRIEKATGEQVESTEVVFQAFGKVNYMIQQMNRSMDEQNQGSSLIAEAHENMKLLAEEVAKAAKMQSQSFQTVYRLVDQVSDMVEVLFAEADSRKHQSDFILQGIEFLRERTDTAES